MSTPNPKDDKSMGAYPGISSNGWADHDQMLDLYTKGLWRHDSSILETKGVNTGQTLIGYACATPNPVGMIWDILSANPSLNVEDDKGLTPFIHLLSNSNCTAGLMYEFIKKGADVSDTKFLLPKSFPSFKVSSLSVYLESSAPIYFKNDGLDLLVNEAKKNGVLQELINFTWFPLLQKELGEESLFFERAICVELCEKLVALKTNFNEPHSVYGRKMIDLALTEGYFQLIPTLIKKGAELNPTGLTPLAIAAQLLENTFNPLPNSPSFTKNPDYKKDLVETVLLMIQSGADPTLIINHDKSGSPLNFLDVISLPPHDSRVFEKIKCVFEKMTLEKQVPRSQSKPSHFRL